MAKYDYVPLSGGDAGDAAAIGLETAPRRQRRNGFLIPLLAVYSVLVTFALLGSITFGSPLTLTSSSSSSSSSKGCDEAEAQARQAPLLSDFKTSLRFNTESPPIDLWDNNAFRGPPSAQTEKAWHELLHGLRHGYGVKISTAEADELGFTGYTLQDDGQVLSAPAVFHALHCMRRVRQYLYADFFYPNATQEEIEDHREHAGHCLETIRSSLTCNPDLTLLRVRHSEDAAEPFMAMPAPVQRCVDWGSLVRVVDGRT